MLKPIHNQQKNAHTDENKWVTLTWGSSIDYLVKNTKIYVGTSQNNIKYIITRYTPSLIHLKHINYTPKELDQVILRKKNAINGHLKPFVKITDIDSSYIKILITYSHMMDAFIEDTKNMHDKNDIFQDNNESYKDFFLEIQYGESYRHFHIARLFYVPDHPLEEKKNELLKNFRIFFGDDKIVCY
ncbi:hypothetical protein EON71_00345 [bacterium]|nr:MAG: hypothetical protein EON71_00345 [bacterium]